MPTPVTLLVPAFTVAALSATAPAQLLDDAPPAVDAAAQVHRPDAAAVTFRADLTIRLRNSRPDDLGTGALAILHNLLDELHAKGVRWERAYAHLTEDQLDHMHARAEAYWQRPIANLNNQFNLFLPADHAAKGLNLADICKQLESFTAVRRAEPHLTGINNDPLPPSYTANQRYFNPAPMGINNTDLHTWPGGRGQGVTVVDVERQWNVNHAEFTGRLLRAGPPTSGDPSASSNDHGTAVMGVLVSDSSTWGTTGAVPDATPYYAHVYIAGLYDVAAAITNAAAVTGPGGVILIEQHMIGPASNYVPMEWRLDCYNAIRTAVGNGIVVCEAAGNGNQNLDAAIYQTGNGGHYPFQSANDSGAIMVGAGAAGFGGTTTARSRLQFSNYGATVDLQGWGEQVFTIGYGNFYSVEGVNLRYTNSFSGTSSATPIVSAAAAQLQGVHRAVTGQWLTPAQVKDLLRATATPQQAGTYPVSQNIGPQPDVRAALMLALGPDCNANNRPDRIDIAMGAPDANANNIPDTCEPLRTCDPDFNGDGDTATDQDIEAFFACIGGHCCPTCASPDFNNDGDTATDQDIESFFRVIGGGPC
ncbi:MAG TPA: S8 family serine peptidase [Phycisphaerales bacterium]|nr:S8 family serine peptidase [Phycisphaerales bacterium]